MLRRLSACLALLTCACSADPAPQPKPGATPVAPASRPASRPAPLPAVTLPAPHPLAQKRPGPARLEGVWSCRLPVVSRWGTVVLRVELELKPKQVLWRGAEQRIGKPDAALEPRRFLVVQRLPQPQGAHVVLRELLPTPDPKQPERFHVLVHRALDADRLRVFLSKGSFETAAEALSQRTHTDRFAAVTLRSARLTKALQALPDALVATLEDEARLLAAIEAVGRSHGVAERLKRERGQAASVVLGELYQRARVYLGHDPFVGFAETLERPGFVARVGAVLQRLERGAR